MRIRPYPIMFSSAKSSISENALYSDDNWLGKTIVPDIPIVDPHHHLWPDILISWLDRTQYRGHLLIAKAEAERSLGETEFVAGQAAMSYGSFGRAPSCSECRYDDGR